MIVFVVQVYVSVFEVILVEIVVPYVTVLVTIHDGLVAVRVLVQVDVTLVVLMLT